jgi:hypothetical protein
MGSSEYCGALFYENRRVIDRHWPPGNPRVSAKRPTVPRTADSSMGLLYSASINIRPFRRSEFRFLFLLAIGREKVMRYDMGALSRNLFRDFLARSGMDRQYCAMRAHH